MTSLLEAKSVHLIGIGGISMSAIAHILLERGLVVTGSDAKPSQAVDTLIAQGATVFIGHDATNIKDQNLIIYTGAIDSSNPEFRRADDLGIPIIRRTQAIDELMSAFPISIAISGTHGKTSTTTMLTMILEAAKQEPSYLVGARLPHTHKAYHMTKSQYIAVEACEYKAGFLDLHPTTIVVNNIEEEHLDFYKSLDSIVDTFHKFSQYLKPGNFLILNQDDPNVRRVSKDATATVLTYGIDGPATYRAINLTYDGDGLPTFDLQIDGQAAMTLTLSVQGKHNVYNCLGAIASAHANGISLDYCKLALEAFSNAERRFETLGTFEGATLVTDYAHHPSEVKATLHSAHNLAHRDIIAVYQPHTYSRTKTLLQETASAFKGCHHVFITDIYAARETNTYNIHASDLVARIAEEGQEVTYVANLSDIPEAIKPYCHENAYVIMMGAGDIDALARTMAQK